MKEKSKKKAAVIFIGIFISFIIIGYISLLTLFDIPGIIKLILGCILLALIGVMIYVVMERLEEIEEGEEDDLSNY